MKYRYSQLLTKYPLSIIAVVLTVVFSSTLLCVFLATPPSFSDPLQGFVPRHSEIHSSYATWQNLIEETAIGSEPGKLLSTFPRELVNSVNQNITGTSKAPSTDQNEHEVLMTSPIYSHTADSSLSGAESFFCDAIPRQGYAQVVISLDKPVAEIDMDSFEALCHLQSRMESLPQYQPTCHPGCLCRSFSLVNYLTYLSAKESCDQLSSEEVKNAVRVWTECRSQLNGLAASCWYNGEVLVGRTCNVSSLCTRSVDNIFYYIVSKDSLLTNTYLHMAKGQPVYPLYLQLNQLINQLKHNPRPVALDFGLKEYVFEFLLLTDSIWILLALFIVISIMCWYTESIFITFMVLCSMSFTLILSYTIYQFAFRVSYFPFLNLLAVVVVVGLGADDLFIYWRTWTAVKHGRNASVLTRIVSHTFAHASAAMFVTSGSTAAAFYACIYTDVVSIRCFCVFAGTCVLVHYVLMVTWVPACVVLYERYSLSTCCQQLCLNKSPRLVKAYESFLKAVGSLHHRLVNLSTISQIWLPLFLLLSSVAAIFLFYWPKLSPPSSDMFQVLFADHPFEVFDLAVKKKFFFSSAQNVLPLTFMFGVSSKFNGEYFNLASNGHLLLKSLPILSHPETQLWFSDFCYFLRQQPFFDRSQSQPVGCFIEELRSSLRFRPCSIHPVCCETLSFPYNESVFTECLQEWSLENRRFKLSAYEPGVRYEGGRPAAIMISFLSNVKFNYNYQSMQQFYDNVTSFVSERMVNCLQDCDSLLPVFSTSGGLLFYDVQRELVDSLHITLLIVVTTAATIIFLTTLNVLLTIVALAVISSSILTTLAVLALMGWQLNILESVIVSLAIGLSMDFPLHVAVAYRMASSILDRKNRVVVSLRHVSGCITCAMVTTLVAGISMLPANVLAYTKLGMFLALLTTISWFYALVFMPSLLIHFGPRGSFLQLRVNCDCKHPTHKQAERTCYSDDITELSQPSDFHQDVGRQDALLTPPTDVPTHSLSSEAGMVNAEIEIHPVTSL